MYLGKKNFLKKLLTYLVRNFYSLYDQLIEKKMKLGLPNGVEEIQKFSQEIKLYSNIKNKHYLDFVYSPQARMTDLILFKLEHHSIILLLLTPQKYAQNNFCILMQVVYIRLINIGSLNWPFYNHLYVTNMFMSGVL